MRSRTLTALLGAAFLAAVPLAAQQSPQPPPPEQKGGQARDSNSRVVSGTVTEYRVGKWLAVRTADNGNETFALDDKDLKVSVDPSVAVGSKVKVTERVNGDSRTLTVEPAAQS